LPNTKRPDVYAGREQFSDTSKISSRDVQRATGRTQGVWVSTNSTWVDRMRFDPEYDLDGNKTGRGIITIEFIDLSMFEYPDRSAADWMDLFESSSKGRFVYYAASGWAYKQLRKASLRGPALAAKKASRAPRGSRQKRRTFTVGGKRGAFGAGGKRARMPGNKVNFA